MAERILFVDDEPPILRALIRTFKSEGYELLSANSASQALDILNATPVSVVISDMRMPVMDGPALLQRVKQFYPQTMRIVLTGYADVAATVKVVNEGGLFGYLSKPWNNQQLKDMVKSAIDTAKRHRARQHAIQKLRTEHDALLKQCFSQTRDMATAEWFVRDAQERLEMNFARMEATMLDLLALKDPTQRSIVSNVIDIAGRLGKCCGLDDNEQQTLRSAARLYAIGKLGLPDRICRSAFETLEPHERDYVLLSGEHAAGVLRRFGAYRAVCDLIGQQRAYLDGSGIFRKDQLGVVLRGSKILTVSIDYVEYRFGRMTGMQLGHDKAILEMLARVKRYDANVVLALKKMHPPIVKVPIEVYEPEHE